MNNTAFIINGLGFGDEGKGTTVDAYARKYESDLVVRFNGGAQAAHNVVTPTGEHHTFSQLGSAMFLPNVRTLLSSHVLFDPVCFNNECNKFGQNAASRVYIDENALLVTCFHKYMNRLRETLRDKKHGSCGLGIGETVADSIKRPMDVLRVKDLRHPDVLLTKLTDLKKIAIAEADSLTQSDTLTEFEQQMVITDVDLLTTILEALGRDLNIVHNDQVTKLILGSNNPIFEGAQGVGIDEKYGFAPYHTWSNTTKANALQLLNRVNWPGSIRSVGVSRTYTTRHGAGPMITEIMQYGHDLYELHNQTGQYQGKWRVGYLDLPLLGYCVQTNGGIDELVITHIDKVSSLSDLNICTKYFCDGEVFDLSGNYYRKFSNDITNKLFKDRYGLGKLENSTQLIKVMSFVAGAPVSLISHGPRSDQKTWLI